MSDTLFNIVLLWLDILDLPPRQCIYTLAIEGWTALPAELGSAILLQMNSTPTFALALVFGGFLLRQKQISMALPTHCRTYLQVIHIRHPFTVLEYSCHKFRCGACDFEYLSSRRTSMFPFHGFKLRFWVMVVNPLLIAYNHTWMEDSWVCVIPGQQGGTSWLNILSANLTHTLDFDKCSRKTVWMVSIDKPVSYTIMSMPIIRFSSTTWWTFWTFSSGPCVILRPE